jgi:tungstate transport system substrate-binding protein
LLVLFAFSFVHLACTRQPDLVLATTTSVRDSGLHDILLPKFEEETGVKVGVVAVGTGRALKLAENGDADLLLVHAPEREKAFVKNGFGVGRIALMHNYFMIAGPPEDPAGVLASTNAADAFARIAESDALFVSRGDDSGTHLKELAIWKAAGIEPDQLNPKQYRQVGQGMGPTLNIADQLSSYVLCDKATYLSYRSRLALRILFEQDPLLHNPYSLIAVSPKRRPHVNDRDAARLIKWLTSVEVQRIITNYKVNGDQLFWPDAHPEVMNGGDRSQPSVTSQSPSPKPSGS